MSTVLSIIFVMMGLSRVLSPLMAFLPERFHAIASAIPSAAKWVSALAGVFWIGLGVGVYQGNASTVRKCVALILVMMGLSTLFWIGAPPQPLVTAGVHVPAVWEHLIFCTIYCGLGLGIFLAHDWALRAAIVAGIAFCLYQVVLGVVFLSAQAKASPEHSIVIMGIALALSLALPIGLIVYCSRPSTREHFAEADASRSPR
jgi:hypothetical protein